jgi:uncharacterized protein (TIGR03089 family)
VSGRKRVPWPPTRTMASSTRASLRCSLMSIVNLFAERLSADGAAPLVTYYDDSTGERVELSAITFDNWVAKTANLMRDELLVEDGDVVHIDLPLHWQALVWMQATWSAGAVVAIGPAGADASPAVTVSTPARIGLAAGQERVALSLRPLGLPCGEPLPAGVHDYAVSVPAHGDRFPTRTMPLNSAALVTGQVSTCHADLLAAAAQVGLSRGQRTLRVGALASLEDAVHAWVAPMSVLGSVVVVSGTDDPARLERIASDEKVSAR